MNDSVKVKAFVQKSGDSWAVEIADIPDQENLYMQSSLFIEIPDLVKELISEETGISQKNIECDIEFVHKDKDG